VRIQRPSLRIIVIAATAGLFILWEIPAARRVAGVILTAITSFDFIYERLRDPSWIGAVFRMLAHPPPGMTLTVIAIALTLIYWTTKPKDRRMTAPAFGMVLCAIGFAGCLFWLLYDRFFGASDNVSLPPTVVTDGRPPPTPAPPAPQSLESPAPGDPVPPNEQSAQRQRYTTAEIDSIIGVLSSLRTSLEDWAKARNDVQRLMASNPRSRIPGSVRPPLPTIEEAGPLADRLQEYAEEKSVKSNAITRIPEQAPLLKSQILPTIEGFHQTSAAYTDALYRMVGILRALTTLQHPEGVRVHSFIQSQSDDLFTAHEKQQQWLARAAQKIDKKVEEARSWR
jgi:hypothetical protein